MDSLLSEKARSTANTSHQPSTRENPPSALSEGDVYAALDLGTNNCRLLIATMHQGEGDVWPTLRVLDSYSRIVRLGEGLGAGGELSEEAIDRTIKALKTCRSKLSRYPQAKLRFVTTEACRRASNAQSFLRLVRQEADMHIEVISSEEEALLAFYGCSSLLKPTATHALTFDIGGGSTEFMWAQREEGSILPKVAGWSTIPFGVMNLSEQFGGTAYTEMYFDEIVERVAALLHEFDSTHRIRDVLDSQRDRLQILSTSGTVTTLAAIHLDLNRYDRSRVDGIELSMKHLRGAVDKLLSMSPSERYHHPCIGSQRADYIISGCAILEAIHRVWPFEALTIADRGVREGIIMGQVLGQKQQGSKHGE